MCSDSEHFPAWEFLLSFMSFPLQITAMGYMTDIGHMGQGEEMGERRLETLSLLSSRPSYIGSMFRSLGPVFKSVVLEHCSSRLLLRQDFDYNFAHIITNSHPSYPSSSLPWLQSLAWTAFATSNQPRHINYKFLQRFKHLGLTYIPVTDDY